MFAAISGYTEEEVRIGLDDFVAEFYARSYLHNPKAWWDSGTKRLIVEIETEDLGADIAEKFVYQNIFEVAVAWIDFSSEEGIRIQINGSQSV